MNIRMESLRVRLDGMIHEFKTTSQIFPSKRNLRVSGHLRHYNVVSLRLALCQKPIEAPFEMNSSSITRSNI